MPPYFSGRCTEVRPSSAGFAQDGHRDAGLLMLDGFDVGRDFLGPEFVGGAGDGLMFFGEVFGSEDLFGRGGFDEERAALLVGEIVEDAIGIVPYEIFENSSCALAAADAHGHHAVARVLALHFAQDGGGELRAGAAQRMPQRDRAAVDVDACPDRGPALRITASAWTAKASFNSITPMSSSFRPAMASALGIATTGPIPMISGGTPATAKLTKRAIGFRPSSSRFLVRHDHRRGRAIAGLRGIAGGDGAVGMEDGLQLGQRFERGVGARAFVLAESRRCDAGALPLSSVVDSTSHGHDLVVELAFSLRVQCVLVAAEGELVGVFARDAVLLPHAFRRSVPCPCRFAGDDPPSRDWARICCLPSGSCSCDSAPPAMMICAPPAADTVGRHGDGLQPGGAETVDGDAGNGIGQTRAQSRDARHIHAGFGFRHGAAQDHVFDLFGLRRRDILRASARMTMAARSSGRVLRRLPLGALPTAVRRQSIITASIRVVSFGAVCPSSAYTACVPASWDCRTGSGTLRAPDRANIVRRRSVRR